MIIKNGLVFTEKNTFEKLDIKIEGERIVKLAKQLDKNSSDDVIDAGGRRIIPGLVDIHFHGAVGHDFCDGDIEGLKAISKYEAENGILAICPATMTYNEEILKKVVENARKFQVWQSELMEGDKSLYASLVGINMEGPFISPDKLGAQNPTYLSKPDVAMFRRLNEYSGNLIKLIDIAPEVEGALDFIDECKDEVNISIAHTKACYETAVEAYKRGARHLTHLYNAMPGMMHREPGPILAAMEAGAEIELIADLIHSHPAMVRLAFKMHGPEHMILISDSMEATGLADGQYSLGGQAVTKKGKVARLTEHGDTIAGSVTNLYDCMKTAITEAGIGISEAVMASTINPARSIGIDENYGSIEAGKYANLIIIEDNLDIRTIINRGHYHA